MLTDEQVHDLVEELWRNVARCDREAARWHDHPAIAAKYAGQRAAYRDVIERINALRHPADEPGRAERETQPPRPGFFESAALRMMREDGLTNVDEERETQPPARPVAQWLDADTLEVTVTKETK